MHMKAKLIMKLVFLRNIDSQMILYTFSGSLMLYLQGINTNAVIPRLVNMPLNYQQKFH